MTILRWVIAAIAIVALLFFAAIGLARIGAYSYLAETLEPATSEATPSEPAVSTINVEALAQKLYESLNPAMQKIINQDTLMNKLREALHDESSSE